MQGGKELISCARRSKGREDTCYIRTAMMDAWYASSSFHHGFCVTACLCLILLQVSTCRNLKTTSVLVCSRPPPRTVTEGDFVVVALVLVQVLCYVRSRSNRFIRYAIPYLWLQSVSISAFVELTEREENAGTGADRLDDNKDDENKNGLCSMSRGHEFIFVSWLDCSSYFRRRICCKKQKINSFGNFVNFF